MNLIIDILIALILLITGLFTREDLLGVVLIFASGAWTMFIIGQLRRKG